jgi:DnaJ-class molecular chaperone
MPGPRMTICPSCAGEGQVPVQSGAGQSMVTCPTCGGKGKVPAKR